MSGRVNYVRHEIPDGKEMTSRLHGRRHGTRERAREQRPPEPDRSGMDREPRPQLPGQRPDLLRLRWDSGPGEFRQAHEGARPLKLILANGRCARPAERILIHSIGVRSGGRPMLRHRYIRCKAIHIDDRFVMTERADDP